MKRIALAAALLVSLAAPAWAGLDAGWAAYERGDYLAALWEWRPLADRGNADAQNNLGVMYANGQGVPQNFAEAVTWYRRAAEQGDVLAQALLGVRYAKGQGVEQDYAEAVKWYRRAAKQGNASAQIILGGMYSRGQGVPPNLVLAHMWLNLAAASSPAGERRDGAVKARELVAKFMTSFEIEMAQRLASEWKPKKE